MKTSTLDDDVAKVITNKNHSFTTIDGTEYCERCGRKKDDVKMPDRGWEYLPCRGFVG